MTTVIGTAREYTLHNLQEYSDYNSTVSAVNSAGQSMQTKLTVTTQLTGKYARCSYMLNALLLIAFQLPMVLFSL